MAKEPDRTEAHSATRGAQESAHRSWWRGVFGNNLRRFRNREERERYMDSLEWQMEDQREQDTAHPGANDGGLRPPKEGFRKASQLPSQLPRSHPRARCPSTRGAH